jgi:EAL domain-containing protein (putative c-di-GMP-specific phosphodiesterase class I)
VAGSVKRALSEARLDPSWLELEVTEPALLRSGQGAQYSARVEGPGRDPVHRQLWHRLFQPVLSAALRDKVKIDKAFVRDLTSTSAAAVVDAIVKWPAPLA